MYMYMHTVYIISIHDMYMYVHVMYRELGGSVYTCHFFLRKVTALGVLCCFALLFV